MRAAAKDFETAQLMGVKINSVISMTFVIGSFLAAVGAMLYFTNYPTVAITSGGMPGLKAFVAAVFGGIGSIPGAVVGDVPDRPLRGDHQGPRPVHLLRCVHLCAADHRDVRSSPGTSSAKRSRTRCKEG